MKQYKLVGEGITQALIATLENGQKMGIPLDPRNSDYAEYLRYTEWVEAGNNPEDFWTRELDSSFELEQPKEEE